MKNITVTLDDEVYRQARIAAAEQNTTVTGLVREYLNSLLALRQDHQRDDVQRLLTVLEHVRANSHYSATPRLSREDIYDRASVSQENA